MDHEQGKKRKRVLSVAEGFLPSKKSPQQQRVHVPKFQSAFGFGQASASASSKKPMGVPSRGQELVVAQPFPERKKPVSMSRRPAPPPPPTELQSVKILLKRPEPPIIPRNDPPSKVVKALPPAFPVITPTIPMKPLQTPGLPIILTDSRDLKPLSTIPFSDISSNDDSILELSSILLQFQTHPDQNHHQQQDILVSPQKNKHLRGGLAERASGMYKKSHTSLYLWRTAIESKPSPTYDSSDITFRVCKIIHTITTGSQHKPSLSITLCRIHIPSIRPFTSKKHLVYVIAKFPDSSKPTTASSSSCNPVDLREGCFLNIWRPWHEIPLAVVLSGSNMNGGGGLSDPDDIPSASLPLPSSNDSSLSISPDDRIHPTVLLCSRFSISNLSVT